MIEKGLFEGLGLLTGLSASMFVLLVVLKVPNPSTGLLEGFATLGTGLLLAYVVEISWLTARIRRALDYERRLGFFVGIGEPADWSAWSWPSCWRPISPQGTQTRSTLLAFPG